MRVIDTAIGSVRTLAATSDYIATQGSPIPPSARIALTPSHTLDGIGTSGEGKLLFQSAAQCRRLGPDACDSRPLCIADARSVAEV